jgi:hypothetical protein
MCRYLKNDVGDLSFLFHISMGNDALQLWWKFKKILLCVIFLKAKILLRNFHTIFLKIEIYKIYRKINSWSKFEDRSPMKLMSKMQIN